MAFYFEWKKGSMQPRNKHGRHQIGKGDNSSSAPLPPNECSVVVLGVMYPNALPNPHCATVTSVLSPSLFFARESTDVLFYDPID